MQIKNVKVFGLEESIIASGYCMQTGEPDIFPNFQETHQGNIKDYHRAKKLANTPVGSGHNNFLKGIIVQFDLKYSQYWTKQLQRYHWFEFVSSQSLMHKLTSVKNIGDNCNKYVLTDSINQINLLIDVYNTNNFPWIQSQFTGANYEIKSKEECFEYIISNLPMGYELWTRISTNYLQLKTMWNQRCKHRHKLKDWEEFGEFIKTLPMAEELIINGDKTNK